MVNELPGINCKICISGIVGQKETSQAFPCMVPKLKYKHIYLTSLSKMCADLAVLVTFNTPTE